MPTKSWKTNLKLTLDLQPNNNAFSSAAVLASVEDRSEAAALSSVFLFLLPMKVR